MMSFKDFVLNYFLREKAASNLKNQPSLSSIELDKVDRYLRNESFSSDIGIVFLHPTKRTHWVAYINENCFDNYGCASPIKQSRFTIKPNGYC